MKSKSSTERQFAIQINNKPHKIPVNSTLESVLGGFSHIDAKAVIVALNGVFIRSADFATQPLLPDDKLMVMGASL